LGAETNGFARTMRRGTPAKTITNNVRTIGGAPRLQKEAIQITNPCRAGVNSKDGLGAETNGFARTMRRGTPAKTTTNNVPTIGGVPRLQKKEIQITNPYRAGVNSKDDLGAETNGFAPTTHRGTPGKTTTNNVPTIGGVPRLQKKEIQISVQFHPDASL
jgi:hypothetical protein